MEFFAGIVRLVYVICHLMLRLYDFLRDLIDSYHNPPRSCWKTESLSVVRKQLGPFLRCKERPAHVAFSLSQQPDPSSDLSLRWMAGLVWLTAAAGSVPNISLYDRDGLLQANLPKLARLIEDEASHNPPTLGNDYEVVVDTGKSGTPKQFQFFAMSTSSDVSQRPIKVRVRVFSEEDGIADLVRLAQETSRLCGQQGMPLKEVTSDWVSEHLEASRDDFPDPDIIILFSPPGVNKMLGYPPWQLRLTEFLFVLLPPSLLFFPFHHAHSS